MDIATGAMNTLLPKLGELLVGEYKLHKHVKGEIEELKEELASMNAALRKVFMVPEDQLDEHVKIWARDVRELSYDIEDAIDTFMVCGKGHDPTQPLNLKGFVDRATNLFRKARTNHQIHNVIKDIMDRVRKASERRDRYKVDEVAAKPIVASVDPRLEAMYRKAIELVGIGKPKNELAKRLMDGDSSSLQQPKIISIVGFGGVGKTTLANALLHDLKAKFECHFFASVSLNPDIKKIFKNILVQLDEKRYANVNEAWDEVNLINKIREFLENRRCLCVIDDVWKESAWDTIKLALQDGNHGSKIIITTRNKAVAEHAGSGVYELKPLSGTDSRKLLNRRIFDSEDGCPPYLSEVAGKILKKCGGVPLAIITTASLLASKPMHLQEWEKVSESIGSGLGNSLDVDKMRKILSLSYYDLPSHLKTCLLSLSKYPEDKKIRRDVLVWSWIAEGFITEETQPAGTRLQKTGERYFSELINRSLIQPASINSTLLQDGQVNACQVHDMVLELITQLSAEEGFVTIVLSVGQQAGMSAVQTRKIRRLSLHNSSNTYATVEEREQLCHVRSLAVFGHANSIPPLTNFHLLRMLQLEGCTDLENNHLNELSSLHHLRFLRLRRSSITKLPESIGKLEFLQTLDIRGAKSVVVLPMSFVNLGQLVRLIADRVKLADGMTLGNMKSLRELVGICATLNAMNEITHLTELRVLKIVIEIYDLNGDLNKSILKCLLRCTNLQELEFKTPGLYYLDFLKQVPSGLQRLVGNGMFKRAFPRWIDSSLSWLTILSIRLFFTRILPPHLEKLSELPSLRFLRIHEVGFSDEQEKLIVESRAHSVRWLTELHFYCGLMFLVFQQRAMQQLRKLSLQFSAAVTNDFFEGTANNFDFGLENLPYLGHVVIHFYDTDYEHHREAEAAIMQALKKNPNHPLLNIVTGGRGVTED